MVANSFSKFFENVIHSLGIKLNEHFMATIFCEIKLKLIKKLEQHPYINLINKNIIKNGVLHFLPAKHESILTLILPATHQKVIHT